jgi:hypothetical protein
MFLPDLEHAGRGVDVNLHGISRMQDCTTCSKLAYDGISSVLHVHYKIDICMCSAAACTGSRLACRAAETAGEQPGNVIPDTSQQLYPVPQSLGALGHP